jgi:hypothetical protein
VKHRTDQQAENASRVDEIAEAHTASAGTLRFCHQATRSTTPAQADAKLPIIIKVGRSSCTMLFGPWRRSVYVAFPETPRGSTGGAEAGRAPALPGWRPSPADIAGSHSAGVRRSAACRKSAPCRSLD